MSIRKPKYVNVIETAGKHSAAPPKDAGSQDLMQSIRQIAGNHPDVSSYAYIRAIHEFFLPLEQNHQARRQMLDRLQADVILNDSGVAVGLHDPQSEAFDFTIYYCLALYCKRKDKAKYVNPSLDTLIRCYDALFSHLPLSLEVRSWLARRTERLDDAYRYDSLLIKQLSIDTNAGVYNSFASSISTRLELECESRRKGNSIFFWEKQSERIRDWEIARYYMPQVIDNWKKVWEDEDGYGKHYFIFGKLLMFSPDLAELSPEARHNRFEEAKEYFRIAKACENPEDADYVKRCSEYESYLRDCSQYELEWQQNIIHTPAPQPSAAAVSLRNRRLDVDKPNEDAYVLDEDNGIFLVADGVTRPHDEYMPDRESLAAVCSQTLCDCVHDYLLHTDRSDPAKALYDAMVAGNQAIRPLRFHQRGIFLPCTTFLGTILKDDTLYFSNCGDGIGLLIRGGVKICLTEQPTYLADCMEYTKEYVYKNLHNNINDPAGFGIFNGDTGLKDFLQVSHMTLEPGDRVILATDGLTRYLLAARAADLCKCSMEELIDASAAYDRLPFQRYADDKTCIIIDI